MVDIKVGRNKAFAVFLLSVLVLVGYPVTVGVRTVQNAGSAISGSEYSQLAPYLNPVQVNYQPEIQPPANSSHIQAALFTLSSSDVFAVSNPATLKIFIAVNNASQVLTINVLIVPAAVNVSQLSANGIAQLVVNQLNAQQGVNFKTITPIIGRTVPVNFTVDGSYQFVVVVAMPNMTLEPPLSTGPFVVYPYTAKLQAVSNQIGLSSALTQTESSDRVEGLTWIILGLTFLQAVFLVMQIGVIKLHRFKPDDKPLEGVG